MIRNLKNYLVFLLGAFLATGAAFLATLGGFFAVDAFFSTTFFSTAFLATGTFFSLDVSRSFGAATGFFSLAAITFFGAAIFLTGLFSFAIFFSSEVLIFNFQTFDFESFTTLTGALWEAE
ncbi:MAG: hypothetical protein WCI00_07235 [bacterium]